MQAKQVAIEENLPLWEVAIATSKDKLKSQEKLLGHISSEFDSSMVLSAQAEVQYKERVANFTLDE